MTILLDNCVRRDLKPYFAPVEGPSRLGSRLGRASQRLRVAVLDVRGNDFTQLIAATKALLHQLESLPEGEFTVVSL